MSKLKSIRSGFLVLAITVFALPLALIGCGGKSGAATKLYPDGYKVVDTAYDDSSFSNPDMGWIYYENAMKYVYDAAGLTTPALRLAYFQQWAAYLGNDVTDVAVMSSWGEIEGAAEGAYDWSYYDEAINFWESQGKSIHLRFCTDCLDFMGVARSAPQWLQTVYGVPFISRIYQGDTVSYPDYSNSVYKQKLTDFMVVFANRYKNDPDIKSVDLRGYGLWGEWHSGYNYQTVGDRRNALDGIIKIWLDAWGSGKIIDISVSYETNVIQPYFDPSMSAQSFMNFSSLDTAVSYPNVTYRRDGVGGWINGQDASLLEEYYNSGRRNPLILEIAQWYGWYEANTTGLTLENLSREAAFYHGEYLSVIGHDKLNSVKFFTDRRDLLYTGLRELGYRLKTDNIAYNDQAAPGGTLNIIHNWENLNYSFAYKNYPLIFSLTDSQGNVAYESGPVADFLTSEIRHGGIYTYNTNLTLPSDLPAGNYTLKYELRNNAGDNRQARIRLANANGDSDFRYTVGTVTVGSASTYKAAPYAYSETFDSGAGAAKLENGAKISGVNMQGVYGNAVEFDGGASAQNTEFMSLPGKLEKNSLYQVRFNYQVLEPTLNSLFMENGFTVKAVDGSGNVLSYRTVRGAKGSFGQTVMYVSTDKSAATLKFSADAGGSFAIDNIQITKISAVKSVNFESDSEALILNTGAASITNNQAQAVNSTKSLFMSQAAGEDDVSIAVVRLAQGSGSHTAVFDSRAVSQNGYGGRYFVKLVNRATGKAEYSFEWSSTIERFGSFSQYAFGYNMAAGGNYELQFGIHGGGKCAIDNLKIIQN